MIAAGIPDPVDARHATGGGRTFRDVGSCPSCGTMACTGNVWPTTSRWRQVVCPECQVRGPAKPSFEAAIEAWQAMPRREPAEAPPASPARCARTLDLFAGTVATPGEARAMGAPVARHLGADEPID